VTRVIVLVFFISVLVCFLFLVYFFASFTKTPKKVLMTKKLGEFATPNENFMRGPIALPCVAA
jgi:hypothetical protein